MIGKLFGRAVRWFLNRKVRARLLAKHRVKPAGDSKAERLWKSGAISSGRRPPIEGKK